MNKLVATFTDYAAFEKEIASPYADLAICKAGDGVYAYCRKGGQVETSVDLAELAPEIWAVLGL